MDDRDGDLGERAIHTDGAEVDIVHQRLLLGEEHLHHFKNVGVGRRYVLQKMDNVRVCCF